MLRCNICFEEDSSVLVIHTTVSGVNHCTHSACLIEWLKICSTLDCPLCKELLPFNVFTALLHEDIEGKWLAKAVRTAVGKSDRNLIHKLMKASNNIDDRFDLAVTIMMEAAETGHTAILKPMLKQEMKYATLESWAKIIEAAVKSECWPVIQLTLDSFHQTIPKYSSGSGKICLIAVKAICKHINPYSGESESDTIATIVDLISKTIRYAERMRWNYIMAPLYFPVEEMIICGQSDELMDRLRTCWPSIFQRGVMQTSWWCPQRPNISYM